MRVVGVDCIVALAGALPRDVVLGSLVPHTLKLASDKSWRVRWSVAHRAVGLGGALGADVARGALAVAFEALLGDTEAEVRVAAAGKCAAYAALVPPEVIKARILAPVARLVSDDSEHVRAAIANVIMNMSSLLGEEATVSGLLPHFLTLLKDKTPEVRGVARAPARPSGVRALQVRLNVISKLDAVHRVVGVKLLSQSLLPAILELSEDKQWRVRLAIVDFMPLLARQLGVDVFNAELAALCFRWLSDGFVLAGGVGGVTRAEHAFFPVFSVCAWLRRRTSAR